MPRDEQLSMVIIDSKKWKRRTAWIKRIARDCGFRSKTLLLFPWFVFVSNALQWQHRNLASYRRTTSRPCVKCWITFQWLEKNGCCWIATLFWYTEAGLEVEWRWGQRLRLNFWRWENNRPISCWCFLKIPGKRTLVLCCMMGIRSSPLWRKKFKENSDEAWRIVLSPRKWWWRILHRAPLSKRTWDGLWRTLWDTWK